MWLYLLIFIIPVAMYYTSQKTGDERNVVQLAVYLAGLALFVGFSDMLGGYDRYIYGEVFDGIADVTDAGGNYIANGEFEFFAAEKGWTVLNILISFYTCNRYIFILSVTLLIYTFLFISLKRYAANYPFALIVFIGLWFFFTFTYLRQVLGATIVWLSIPYIIKRKFWKFAIIALLACTLHKSAIIFFPIYFIVNRSYTRKQIICFMALALIAGVSPLPNALFSAYGDMSTVELQNDYNAAGGFRIAYFLEASFFLWIMLRNYTKGYSDMSKRVMFNIACLFCATLLFFIRSENGGRLSWYYMIGIICTLTDVANRYVNRKSFAPILIVICLFLNIRVYNTWQVYLNLYPYKTFFTNGYRVGDYSWENYEYDHEYDVNKLYREPFRLKTNLDGLWK